MRKMKCRDGGGNGLLEGSDENRDLCSNSSVGVGVVRWLGCARGTSIR